MFVASFALVSTRVVHDWETQYNDFLPSFSALHYTLQAPTNDETDDFSRLINPKVSLGSCCR